MPSKHKTPLVGWHPPADLAAWARSEAERREVHLSVILTEALAFYRDTDTEQCDNCGVSIAVTRDAPLSTGPQ